MTTPTSVCPNCGASRPPLGRFCGACGQEYPTAPPATVRGAPSAGSRKTWILVIGAAVVAIALLSKPSGPASSGGGANPPPKAAAILLQESGNGIKNTGSFTVTGPWQLIYTFDCASFGSSGNFIVEVADSSGRMVDIAVNELAAKGSSSSPQYTTGTLHLEINSECAWAVKVSG
jgi:hypothetical protein